MAGLLDGIIIIDQMSVNSGSNPAAGPMRQPRPTARFSGLLYQLPWRTGDWGVHG